MAEVPPAPQPPTEDDRLNRAWATLSEFFPDAMIFIRGREGLKWRYSDPTWAAGAAHRFCEAVDHGDRLEIDMSSSGAAE